MDCFLLIVFLPATSIFTCHVIIFLFKTVMALSLLLLSLLFILMVQSRTKFPSLSTILLSTLLPNLMVMTSWWFCLDRCSIQCLCSLLHLIILQATIFSHLLTGPGILPSPVHSLFSSSGKISCYFLA